MNPLQGARRLSAVTFHAAAKAQTMLHGLAPTGVRFYQTRPTFTNPEMLAPEKMVNDFVRKQDLSAAAATLKFNYRDISTDKDKWMDAVEKVNALSGESPLRDMTGEQVLALLFTLLKAGHACGANINSAEFAVLPLNLHALGQLSFPSSDKGALGRFARATVDALTMHLPSRGIDFVDMPSQERRKALNGFAAQILLAAFDLGIGPRAEDMDKLREITFSDDVHLGAGGFSVDRESSKPRLLLGGELLSSDLNDTLTAFAQRSGQAGPDQIANYLLVQHVTTIAHELVHASQYSALSGVPADREQFLQLQANKFSLATEQFVDGRGPQYQNPDDQFIFHLHEMKAWYTTFMSSAAVSQSPRLEPGLREAARELVSTPRNSRMADELMGHEPRGFAKIKEGMSGHAITSQPRVDRPKEHIDTTMARLEEELNKAAPAP